MEGDTRFRGTPASAASLSTMRASCPGLVCPLESSGRCRYGARRVCVCVRVCVRACVRGVRLWTKAQWCVLFSTRLFISSPSFLPSFATGQQGGGPFRSLHQRGWPGPLLPLPVSTNSHLVFPAGSLPCSRPLAGWHAYLTRVLDITFPTHPTDDDASLSPLLSVVMLGWLALVGPPIVAVPTMVF